MFTPSPERTTSVSLTHDGRARRVSLSSRQELHVLMNLFLSPLYL